MSYRSVPSLFSSMNSLDTFPLSGLRRSAANHALECDEHAPSDLASIQAHVHAPCLEVVRVTNLPTPSLLKGSGPFHFLSDCVFFFYFCRHVRTFEREVQQRGKDRQTSHCGTDEQNRARYELTERWWTASTGIRLEGWMPRNSISG